MSYMYADRTELNATNSHLRWMGERGESEMEEKKPHVVCIPCPAQGHINPMMQVAKLLHSRGCSITFVNTDYSHKRLLASRGLDSLECLDDLRFATISDGLPPSFKEAMDDAEGFAKSLRENCAISFRDLLKKLHHSSGGPPVSCVVSDGVLTFTLKIAEEMGIPDVIFYPAAACAFMAFAHYRELITRGFAPLKDESNFTDGYLDTTIDWIPGLKEMRLRDLGSFLKTTDPNDFFLNFLADEAQNCLKASAIIFNTFNDLEHETLLAIQSLFHRPIYTIGPLFLLNNLMPDKELKLIKTSLWKEETGCLKWLDNFKVGSVIYVNFGSTTITTFQQFMEFALGIANSKHPFLWVIRPDLVMDGHTNLPEDYMNEVNGRGMVVTWCPQQEVLAHPSIGVFLTHCGWNSTLESISLGVPMLCWPFFSDQQNICFYACKEWGVGMEIDNNAKKEEISVAIKESMDGEKGKEMKEKALKWRKSAAVAIKEGGSSHNDLELLIYKLLHRGEN